MNTKHCSKCNKIKKISEFGKNRCNIDNLQYYCKECKNEYQKIYRQNNKNKMEKYGQINGKYYQLNKEKMNKQSKAYRQSNKEKIKEYYKTNKEKMNEHNKIYCESKANYNTYVSKILYAEEVKNVDGFIQTKCAYCGKWYFPLNKSVQIRINALNGQYTSGTENRFYCSTECKKACPIYNQKKWPKGFKQATSREVQPELRQMVLKRDNYTCLKCGKNQDELDVPLHCHHVEGIRWEPIESADIDKCMTTCQNCHIEIHKQEDCRYIDMRCERAR